MPWLFFVTTLTFLDFLDDVGIAYILERLYRIHQIQLLGDHQELACTPKDPPRRVSMTQMSFRFVMETFVELSTKPFENLLL